MVHFAGLELDLDDLPALCAIRRRKGRKEGRTSRAYVSDRNGWSGQGTYGVVDVGADDEALSPAGRM